MATPTISEYTAHLRVDKAGMRDHLLSANIETKESDTFTDLSKKVLEAGSAIRQIYVQPEEPATKHGLWFKTDTITDFDVVSDPVPFIGDSLLEFNKGFNPDADYTKGKETRFVCANNILYYLVMEDSRSYNPNEIFRIYKYEPISNTFSRIQTYTATEVSNVRGNGGYYEFSTFNSNCAVCIDANGDYLYIVGGGHNASADSQKYITRFGLTTHSAERVHTKKSEWYAISGANLATAQIVDDKLYVFGTSSNASAYGATFNTRIIDLTNNTETVLGHGPIAYKGVTIKVNSHLIAGFGGGHGSSNAGTSMKYVHLFDTLTNKTTRIAELTNENNTRTLAVVGGLIYFAEYDSIDYTSNSVGYVNLSDNSVTYIEDVFTPKIQNLAYNPALYIPSMRAIMFGAATSQNYVYTLKTKPYNKNTIILFQSAGIAAQCSVNLFTTNNFVTDVKFDLSDAWLYKPESGLDNTSEVYYGTGTKWVLFKHGSTTGGVNALELQHKTVTITDRDTHVTPDPGFEGLSYVDLQYTGELQEDLTDELTDYDTKLITQEDQLVVIAKALKGKMAGGSTEPVIEPDYITDGLIAWWEGADGFDENAHWNSRVGEDYISVDGYAFGTANDNNIPHSKGGAVYNDGVFSMVTQVDYCKTGYTVQIVGYSEGVVADAGNDMCTFIGFNMSSSPMIGLKSNTYTLWTSNGYQPTHEVSYNNLNKRVFNASLSLNKAPTRSTSVSTPLDNSYSLNGGAWKSSSLSSNVHSSQGNNMTVLSYYTANWRAVGARIYSIRVYNRKLTEEELQYNFEIDKARFNIEELEG